jgi:hypothetical protein
VASNSDRYGSPRSPRRRATDYAFVCLDSNIIDLFLQAQERDGIADAMEACERPPPYLQPDHRYERELLASYWLMAIGAAWSSVLYTFSDQLYIEVGGAQLALAPIDLAAEVREFHPESARVPDSTKCAALGDLAALGLHDNP